MLCDTAVIPAPRGRVCLRLLLLLSLLNGCTQSLYEVEMTVEGETVQRTLTASMSANEEDHPPAPEEAQRLAIDYAEPAVHDDRGRLTVAGEFVGRLPDDVGGRGEVAHWETSLGSLSVYLERFRGDVDLHGQFTERIARVDQAVDLLKAWVDFAAADSPDGDQLRAFVDGEFRGDIRNLALYVWLGLFGQTDETAESKEQSLSAQLIQYAIERGYVELSEVPNWQSGPASEKLAPLRDVFSRKLKIDEITSALPALASEEALRQSFDEQFRSSDAYREFLARHDIEVDDDTVPSKVLGEITFTTLGLLQGYDRLIVRLRVPQQPFVTNGNWTGEGEVHWDTELPSRDSLPAGPLPTLHFAAWSQPDTQTQQARFGRTLLADRALADYVLWRTSLPEESADEWEQFLGGLKPDDDLQVAVETYRETAGDESRLARGCELLATALEESPP